jgi:hypothetical protein
VSLSTSNSNRNQVSTILWVALTILLSYEFLVRLQLVPKGDGTSMQSVNIVRVEQFLQNLRDGQGTVLVGSSLIGNLQQTVWQDGVANIGQSGGNALTGLELILRQPVLPKGIIVDVSRTISGGLDESVLVPLQPLSYFGHKLLKCTQESYKPSNVFLSAARRRLGKATEPRMTETLRREGIERIVRSNLNALDDGSRTSFTQALKNLKVKINALTSRGVKVALVSIPTQPEVDRTLQANEFVNLAHRILPEAEGFKWIPISARSYETTEGVHLVAQDAEIVRIEILNGFNSWVGEAPLR